MTNSDKFSCKIGKYQMACELINSTNIRFRVECMADFILYESVYNNDTLPIQYKFIFDNSVVKLFDYIKNKPQTKLQIISNQLLVIFQLIGQSKFLSLHLQTRSFKVQDLICTINGLKQANETLKQKYNHLKKEKHLIEKEYKNFRQEKDNQITEMRQKIQNLKDKLRIKKNQEYQIQNNDRIDQQEQEQEQQQIYDSQQQEKDQENNKKYRVLRPPNMSCVKDELVIIWNKKKDIIISVQHLNRYPDCLTIKITGKQGQNANRGIKELSQILPRVHQLKFFKILNIYYHNSTFAKSVSLNSWDLRATIIAHLKIKFVNFIIGPKTWKKNKNPLLKQIQLYSKKIVINTQIQHWK